jgi:hypothetical protein
MSLGLDLFRLARLIKLDQAPTENRFSGRSNSLYFRSERCHIVCMQSFVNNEDTKIKYEALLCIVPGTILHEATKNRLSLYLPQSWFDVLIMDRLVSSSSSLSLLFFEPSFSLPWTRPSSRPPFQRSLIVFTVSVISDGMARQVSQASSLTAPH